ncbi:hypothetical protein DVH24_006584 [Malus domestica]|uniref:Uncharacterized protein n=1 Tax=Malus domestica TaxID=3750 RepID=A0A498KDA5_MALDO|nr:hypothetical protein DVH24_006584 [Malus domestica]
MLFRSVNRLVCGQDGTGRNREGAKMPSDGNREEEEGDRDVIILCFTDVRTKRGMEHLVPLRFVPSFSKTLSTQVIWYISIHTLIAIAESLKSNGVTVENSISTSTVVSKLDGEDGRILVILLGKAEEVEEILQFLWFQREGIHDSAEFELKLG